MTFSSPCISLKLSLTSGSSGSSCVTRSASPCRFRKPVSLSGSVVTSEIAGADLIFLDCLGVTVGLWTALDSISSPGCSGDASPMADDSGFPSDSVCVGVLLEEPLRVR